MGRVLVLAVGMGQISEF